MSREFTNPQNVHAPIGNGYSHAVRVGNTIYLAGQVALDRDGNLVGKGDGAVQAEQAFQNVLNVLQAVGATVNDVVKITAYLARREDIPAARAARANHFRMVNPPPATLLLVDGLASPDFLIEVEAVAVLDS